MPGREQGHHRGAKKYEGGRREGGKKKGRKKDIKKKKIKERNSQIQQGPGSEVGEAAVGPRSRVTPPISQSYFLLHE